MKKQNCIVYVIIWFINCYLTFAFTNHITLIGYLFFMKIIWNYTTKKKYNKCRSTSKLITTFFLTALNYEGNSLVCLFFFSLNFFFTYIQWNKNMFGKVKTFCLNYDFIYKNIYLLFTQEMLIMLTIKTEKS